MSVNHRLLEELDHARRELAEAEAALPAHSVRPQQMQRVLELEERVRELERLLEPGPE